MTHGGRRNTRVVAAVCAGMAEAYMLGILGGWRPGLGDDTGAPGGAGTASAVVGAAMVVTAVGIVMVWLPPRSRRLRRATALAVYALAAVLVAFLVVKLTSLHHPNDIGVTVLLALAVAGMCVLSSHLYRSESERSGSATRVRS
jgi:peptidoglycan/LPS O-acetylase OafA/YrhL